MSFKLIPNGSKRMFFTDEIGNIKIIECANCRELKHESRFSAHKGKKYGKQVYCKPCDELIRKNNRLKQRRLTRWG